MDRIVTISRFGVLVVGLVGGVGCTQLTPAARQSLVEADRLYKSGQYGAARQSLDGWLAEHEAAPQAAEAYYLRGLCRLRLKERSAGQGDLEQAHRTARRADLKSHAAATLGCMAFEDGRLERAVGLLNEAADGLPAKPPLDVVLYRLGTAQQRTGQWSAARESYSRVASAVPQSPLILSARRKLNWPHDYFSIQCGAFKTAGNAGQAVAGLRAKGFEAVQEVDRRAGTRLYRVYAGRYGTWAEANRAMAAIRSTGRDALIVP